jgi:hypothetical protein
LRGSIFQITTFIELTAIQSAKAELPSQLEETPPHSHVNLPPIGSVEATGVCKPTGNSEMMIPALHKAPGHNWSNADITELLSFINKCILAADPNAKHPFYFRIAQFQTIWAQNCCSCLMLGISKSQGDSNQLVTAMWEMEMCWLSWSIRISLPLISWTQITDQ